MFPELSITCFICLCHVCYDTKQIIKAFLIVTELIKDYVLIRILRTIVVITAKVKIKHWLVECSLRFFIIYYESYID